MIEVRIIIATAKLSKQNARQQVGQVQQQVNREKHQRCKRQNLTNQVKAIEPLGMLEQTWRV